MGVNSYSEKPRPLRVADEDVEQGTDAGQQPAGGVSTTFGTVNISGEHSKVNMAQQMTVYQSGTEGDQAPAD